MTTARLRATPAIETASRCAEELIRNITFAISSSLDGMLASSWMFLTSTARPSTKPALNVNAGFVLAYVVSAFASATGSAVVQAIEVIPFRLPKTSFDAQSFRRLVGNVVLDDLVAAARAADGLAQFVILLHGHLFVAGDEDCGALLELLAQRFQIFGFIVSALHVDAPVSRT